MITLVAYNKFQHYPLEQFLVQIAAYAITAKRKRPDKPPHRLFDPYFHMEVGLQKSYYLNRIF